MTKTKIILIFSSLIFISVIAFLRSNYLYTPIVDDPYIFFRYAENIVNGYGFVWNIGEQPIEGYTSFLYLVVLIFAKFLSLDLELFSIIFGIITSTLTLYFSFLIYQHLHSHKNGEILENVITVILIALSPAFLFWSVAGMETSFYSMLLLLAVYSFLKLPDLSHEIIKGKVLKKDRNYLTGLTILKGVLFGLLCVLRFEAVLFFLAALYYLTKEDNSLIKLRINRNVILFASGFTLIFGTYFLWRWNYFGYFLPNTFYAKTGAGLTQITGGIIYTILSFKSFYGFAWIPIFITLLFFKREMFSEKIAFISSLGLISIFTTIIIGGDHFGSGRFILPVVPFLFIIFPPALHRLLNSKIVFIEKKIMKVAFIFLFIAVVLSFKTIYRQAFGGLQNLFYNNKGTVLIKDKLIRFDIFEWQHAFIIMGRTLNKIADKDDYIAAIPIGAISYYSKIKVLDMMGIVDPVIAHKEFSSEYLREWEPGHNKGDGKYILSRKPEFIQLIDYFTRKPQQVPGDASLRFKSVAEIWNSEEFQHNYEFFPLEVMNGWYYNLYKRKK